MGHDTGKIQTGNVRGDVSHKLRHQQLHAALDELFADYITHGRGGTTDTILDLITWSHEQTVEPSHTHDS